MRSSTPSIPTDSRISAESTARAVSETDMWVIAAGTSMSDSTPPRDSARVIRRVPSAIAIALSAGERARLALARVVLADRPWVFLDEPSAHLDDITERVIADTIVERTR